jgi:hypothetical protein
MILNQDIIIRYRPPKYRANFPAMPREDIASDYVCALQDTGFSAVDFVLQFY